MKSIALPIAAAAALLSAPAQAAIIQLDLLGKGGAGLLSTNENSAIAGTPGTGGEILGGITYDDVSKILTIQVGWGSLNGFSDLTGAASASHIHGPTASSYAGAFFQNPGVLFNLPRVDSSANGGSINHSVTLTLAQEADLFLWKYYVNIHTTANGGGEIRGNIVPEPSHAILGLTGLALLGLRRRR